MKSIVMSLTIILAVVFISCSGDKGTDTPKTPQITSIIPSSARIGDTVTITGLNFGTSRGSGFVSFTGANATDYLSWNDTEIKLKVPVGTTTGKVSVTVNGVKSNEVDFILITTGPGNYETVSICNQVWMTKNLDVDHYRNGDSIPEVRDETAWSTLKTGAWCYYNNDPAMGAIYGKLYNWFAVNDQRGLAHMGWHVPSDTEWKTLEMCLGMTQAEADKDGWRGTDEGGKLKEAGTSHWESPNIAATNSSEFSALPSGWRGYDGAFGGVGIGGNWWSATESGAADTWGRYLGYSNTDIYRGNYGYKESALSVRCVRD